MTAPEWWPAYILDAFGGVPVTDAELEAAGDDAAALVRRDVAPVIALFTGERVA